MSILEIIVNIVIPVALFVMLAIGLWGLIKKIISLLLSSGFVVIAGVA